MRQLLVVAPLGRVVTGRSVVSRFVADRLRAAGVPVTEVDVGPRSRSVAARLLRPAGFVAAIGRLLLHGRGRIGAVYLAVDAGAGMWLTTAVVAHARLVGVGIALHHHSYAYLEARRIRAASLLAVAGGGAVNIVNCASMRDNLCRRYGVPQERCLVLSNVVTVAEAAPRAVEGRAPRPWITLGYLSNLSFAKGLADAIATGIAVADRLPGSRLLVAGPCADRAASSYLRAALRRHGRSIEYLGPVDDAEKAAFLGGIDVLLFPSRYRHETQGIVNFEALAHGVPIVSRAVGCIGEDFHDAPGTIVPRDDDFVRAACDAIVGLVEAGGLGEEQRAARSYFHRQRRDAQAQLDTVVATVRTLTA